MVQKTQHMTQMCFNDSLQHCHLPTPHSVVYRCASSDTTAVNATINSGFPPLPLSLWLVLHHVLSEILACNLSDLNQSQCCNCWKSAASMNQLIYWSYSWQKQDKALLNIRESLKYLVSYANALSSAPSTQIRILAQAVDSKTGILNTPILQLHFFHFRNLIKKEV